jgi:NAD(P)-dependent dehydrogenase (short-subunit alcohol dehydrogenase family)
LLSCYGTVIRLGPSLWALGTEYILTHRCKIAGPMVDIPLEEVKQVFETNTFAILRVCKAVTPIMAKRKSGTIVNIGSVVGEV